MNFLGSHSPVAVTLEALIDETQPLEKIKSLSYLEPTLEVPDWMALLERDL